MAVAVVMIAVDHLLAIRGWVKTAVVVSPVGAIAFTVVVASAGGGDQAVAYLSAYGAERLLSVDNVVVLLAVMAAFGLSGPDRNRVFAWGLNAALLLRVALALAGVGVIEALWWSEPILGALLAVGGVYLAFQARRTGHESGLADRVGARLAGRGASSLWVAVAAVVVTDAVFAVDSVPTVVAFAPYPFPAVSAAVLSVLGLRPLGILVGGWVARLRYLQTALGAVLVAVGAKLAMTPVLIVPDQVALGVVASLIAVGVLASILWPDRRGAIPDDTAGPYGPETVAISDGGSRPPDSRAAGTPR